MAAACSWNPFAKQTDHPGSNETVRTLGVNCPAWTSWCIQLPSPASIEAMVTAGALQISASGKTERVLAGQRLALPEAQTIFIYSIGTRDAAVALFNVPSGRVHIRKIPAA